MGCYIFWFWIHYLELYKMASKPWRRTNICYIFKDQYRKQAIECLGVDVPVVSLAAVLSVITQYRPLGSEMSQLQVQDFLNTT